MDNYFLDVESPSCGGYFSSEQIDLLRIVEASSIEELIAFDYSCDQINLTRDEYIEIFSKGVEAAKRDIFKKYQDSMVKHDSNSIHIVDNTLSNVSLKYHLTEEDISYIKSNGRDKTAVYSYLRERYPDVCDDIISLQHHFVSQERDLLKDPSLYDEFVELSTHLEDFDTMLVGSGRIFEVVDDFYDSNEPSKRFDFYKAERDLDFAYTHGKNVRYHTLLCKQTDMLEGKSKEEVIEIMKDYVKASIDFINEVNSTHKVINDNGEEVPLINAVDLFNEIVSFNKNEAGEYYNIWEDKFGITVNDLAEVFTYARENKPEGVSFLYNEPFLEDVERRNKVFETLDSIDREMPGLIDTLGYQMHIKITESDKVMEDCFEAIGEYTTSRGKKFQITEADLSVGSDKIEAVSRGDYSSEDVYEAKKAKVTTLSNIINKTVKLDGLTYWSLTDKIDCNLERLRTNFQEQFPNAFGGLYPTNKEKAKEVSQNSPVK